MKKNNLITLFCAVLFCTAAEAQQDVQVKTMEAHENFYVIDGKHIENFDGSQLVGKTIKHSPKESGCPRRMYKDSLFFVRARKYISQHPRLLYNTAARKQVLKQPSLIRHTSALK